MLIYPDMSKNTSSPKWAKKGRFFILLGLPSIKAVFYGATRYKSKYYTVVCRVITKKSELIFFLEYLYHTALKFSSFRRGLNTLFIHNDRLILSINKDPLFTHDFLFFDTCQKSTCRVSPRQGVYILVF